MQVVERIFKELSGYRRGATYHRMDLHTHSPASECSSFSLPGIVEELVPKKPKSGVRAWRKVYDDLRASIRTGNNPFVQPFEDAELTTRPGLNKKKTPPRKDLREIIEVWFAEIERGQDRDTCLERLVVDLHNFLASFLFPEEFVIRCLIEGLHLVALTDHNHPGYIVPRLPKLGTWYDALVRANEVYTRDIRKKEGTATRQTLVARLELAKARLEGALAFDEEVIASRATRHNHPKKRKEIKDRLQHVEDHLAHWQEDDTDLRPLTLLPGTEITVSNVHLLSIYPPAWYVPGRIAGALRGIGIPEEHWGRGFEAAASASVQDAISIVDELGGIAIPAHANSDFKGVLRLFEKGLALTRVLEHPALLAVETTGGAVIKGKRDACEALRWLYKGKRDRSKPISLVKGSDAHECRIELDGTGEDLGQRFTYVKLDIRENDTVDEVFAALRLALMSGQSRIIEFPVDDGYNYAAPKQPANAYRIRKEDRKELLECEHKRPTIIGLEVEGERSYADGIKIRFSPFLNSVVGSGGKSTVVRLLTYAFGSVGFMESTKPKWLPATVRVYWKDGAETNCVERVGKHIDPNDDGVAVRWLVRNDDGTWNLKAESAAGQPVGDEIRALAEIVDIWPSAEVQKDPSLLSSFEKEVVEELASALSISESKPLLVNQPRDIFNSEPLFEAVLAQPRLKTRQIIWSTGSANVPTALDAEKIIVTGETRGGKQMEVLVAGDFHEDEIREAFLSNFEGGWLGFARRVNLYGGS